jgi:UDP:flavonoid glycosyltransferase YjiC (YdhE family)
MRVLLTCHPGISHLESLETLAAALGAAGHQVAVATAASFVDRAEAAGLEAFPAGPDWELERAETMPEVHAAGARGGGIAVFAALAGRGMVEDLVAIGRSWKPDLIVRNAMEFAGWVAAEKLGVPVAAQNAAHLVLPLELLRMFAGPALADLPAAYGLPPDPALQRLYGYPYLHTLPARVDPGGTTLPGTLFRYRHAVFAPPPPLPPALSWVDGLAAERPIVHASLGTVFGQSAAGDRVNRAIIDGLAGEPVHLVLVTGPAGDPQRYGPLPPNTRVLRYIRPYRPFVDRCSVLLTHGGYGTVLQAVAAGAPMGFLPLKAEQPVVAARYSELGLGLNAARTGPGDRRPFPVVDPDTLTPDGIRGIVRRLLAEPGFRADVTALRAEATALPDPAEAVRWLESVV